LPISFASKTSRTNSRAYVTVRFSGGSSSYYFGLNTISFRPNSDLYGKHTSNLRSPLPVTVYLSGNFWVVGERFRFTKNAVLPKIELVV